MIDLLKKNKELIMYLLFGVLTTVVNIVTYYICAKVLHIDYQIANIIAWLVCVTFAYITNKLYVFDSKSIDKVTITKEIISFYGFRVFSLVIDVILLYIFVKSLLLDDMIAKILINIFVIIINYITSKIFVFKK